MAMARSRRAACLRRSAASFRSRRSRRPRSFSKARAASRSSLRSVAFAGTGSSPRAGGFGLPCSLAVECRLRRLGFLLKGWSVPTAAARPPAAPGWPLTMAGSSVLLREALVEQIGPRTPGVERGPHRRRRHREIEEARRRRKDLELPRHPSPPSRAAGTLPGGRRLPVRYHDTCGTRDIHFECFVYFACFAYSGRFPCFFNDLRAKADKEGLKSGSICNI